MKMLMKNSSGKAREKMPKKVKEKINLFTLKVLGYLNIFIKS